MEKPESEQQPEPKSSLFAELKRRKVFRVAGTYIVVSWLIIQVAAATFPNFGIPVWAFRFVVLMVLLGFPVAIILAWALELTPEGVRRSGGSASKSVSEAAALNRKRSWLAIGLAAALPTLIFGTLAIIFYFNRPDTGSDEPGTAREFSYERPYVIGSLAVLPFTIISDNPRTKLTADGLQDEMLTSLSEMDPLNVISRTSTLRYGDFTSSIPEIGAALGADFVVEGSIQSVGDNVRVTLQLIEANEDNHIWAEAFDRDPQSGEDLLQFHKELSFELAIRIYQVLERTYPPTGEAKRIREDKLASLKSRLDTEYAAYWVDTTGADRIDRYRSLENIISEIIRIDPDNKDAHDRLTGLSFSMTDLGLREFFDPEWRKEFYLILKRAYVVDPDGFDVNKHLGIYYFNYENRPNEAIPYSRKALQIERELRGVVDIYTYWILLESLYATGQNTAALEIVEKASSENVVIFSGLGWFWTHAYTANGLWEKAIAFLDEQIGRNEEFEADLGADELNALLSYRFTKARILARWTGDGTSLWEFYGKYQDSPLFALINKAFFNFYSENYQTTLDLLSRIQLDSATSTVNAVDLAEMRGWSYLKTGNPALAQSYFKGYLNELLDSPRARWQETFRPDRYAAELSYAYACLGNREEALKWAQTAIEDADPSRNFEDYFNTLGQLVVTYGLLEDFQMACELIDQILSSPCGWTTGDFLLNPQMKTFHAFPDFEVVIRKHADQLKDPSVLDAVFATAPTR